MNIGLENNHGISRKTFKSMKITHGPNKQSDSSKNTSMNRGTMVCCLWVGSLNFK
jgi:hypothetical protein